MNGRKQNTYVYLNTVISPRGPKTLSPRLQVFSAGHILRITIITQAACSALLLCIIAAFRSFAMRPTRLSRDFLSISDFLEKMVNFRSFSTPVQEIFFSQPCNPISSFKRNQHKNFKPGRYSVGFIAKLQT